MSDLISRSDLYMNDLIRRKDVLALFSTNDCSDKMIGLYERVLDIPTAYDISKVVEKLEDKSSNYKKSYKSNGKNTYKTIKAISKNKAINIVRKGGVE